MDAIKFIIKFTSCCLIAWVVMATLSLVLNILGHIWEFLFAGIGIYGVYLVVSGKYKSFEEKMESICSKIVGVAKE